VSKFESTTEIVRLQTVPGDAWEYNIPVNSGFITSIEITGDFCLPMMYQDAKFVEPINAKRGADQIVKLSWPVGTINTYCHRFYLRNGQATGDTVTLKIVRSMPVEVAV
jgi:hypothetical protein